MGRWWVIGNIPYFAENGKVATADVYALRPDGRIENVYVYRKAFDKPEKRMNAIAKVIPGTNNAQWKIAFFGGLLKADLPDPGSGARLFLGADRPAIAQAGLGVRAASSGWTMRNMKSWSRSSPAMATTRSCSSACRNFPTSSKRRAQRS